MDFELTPDQITFRDELRAFARDALTPRLETPNAFPRAAWEACAAEGIFNWRSGAADGGAPRSRIDTVIGLEALAYGCPSLGFVYGISASSWSLQTALIEFANEEQKTRYLVPLARGTRIGAFAMSELEAGSDTANIRTRAVRDGEFYILNGSKAWVTFGPIADFALVFASTNPDAGRWGISAFMIDSETDGFHRSAEQAKLGLDPTPVGSFDLVDCRIHESQRVGAEGVGSSLFAKVMENERGLILGFCLGAVERQLQACVTFARHRKQFGQAVGKFQSVANRVVDMKTRLELSRLLTYKVATLQDGGNPAHAEAAMAKLYVGEPFVTSSIDAVRTLGARGFFPEYGIANDLPDAIGGLIYGGTGDVQRMVIARMLGLGG